MLQRIDFMGWGSTQLLPDSCAYGRRGFIVTVLSGGQLLCGPCPLSFPLHLHHFLLKIIELPMEHSPQVVSAVTGKPLDLPETEVHPFGAVY